MRIHSHHLGSSSRSENVRHFCPSPTHPFNLYRRGVHDVVHKVVAVGSRDTSKAQIFIDEHAGVGSNIQAYGTYEEVYSDPVNRFNNAPAIPLTASQNVDVVYVGSPVWL